MKKIFFFLFFLLGGALLIPAGPRAEQKPGLAFLPLFVERGEAPGRGAICPICSGVRQKGEILPSAPVILKRLLYSKLETLNLFQILPPEKGHETLSPLRWEEMEKKPMSLFMQVGKELSVDFLLAGFLFRFEERVGSSLGVEKPASVGFELHLFRIRDGKITWEAKFDETQKPLSEDLLRIRAFFRRGATWLTAEELAGAGMDEMLRNFPGPKELQE